MRGFVKFAPFVTKGNAAAFLLLLTANAVADPLLTLTGNSPQAIDENNSRISIEVHTWTGSRVADGIVEEFMEFQESGNFYPFKDYLQERETYGFLHTEAVSHYAIKYAWRESSGDDSRMVFLVTPALKTYNPTMWYSSNSDERGFSLVELQWDGEQAIAKTSMDGEITVKQGTLALADFAGSDRFASLQVHTPFSLNQEEETFSGLSSGQSSSET